MMKEGEVLLYRTIHGHWQQGHSWEQAPTLQIGVPVLWSTCVVTISLLLLSSSHPAETGLNQRSKTKPILSFTGNIQKLSAAEELETCAEPLSLQVHHWSLVAHRATNGPGFPSQKISLAPVLALFLPPTLLCSSTHRAETLLRGRRRGLCHPGKDAADQVLAPALNLPLWGSVVKRASPLLKRVLERGRHAVAGYPHDHFEGRNS